MTFSLHRSVRAFLSIFVIGGLLSATSEAATYTLAPVAYQTVQDTNGNPVSGAKICTYLAGTTTPAATFSDASGTPNLNPIRADSAGRWTAYLAPGASYKFIFQDATGTVGTCDGVTLRTQDNIFAVPSSSTNVDITGTAGEALTAGQAVYLSDGSGSKNAGQWYKADSANAYSSTLPQLGMVPASIVSGSPGTIRLGGQMTGLTVTAGTTYYVGTAGAITATAPVQARKIGAADSTSTLVFPNTAIPILPWTNDFRLTLTSGAPVTIADVTGASATTIYCSPMWGNRIDLPDATGNPQRVTSAEFSIAVPATTSTMYDVFAYLNGATATLELLSTTRTDMTGLTRTNGRWMKTGDSTRMYLGSFRTTTVSGQTEDSKAKRHLWNNYNRMRRLLEVNEATDSWPYTIATMRQANGSAANQVDVLIGVADVLIEVNVLAHSNNSGGGVARVTAIGEDSTTTATGQVAQVADAAAVTMTFAHAHLSKYPAVGRHFYAWLEYSIASNTTTWYGDNGNAQLVQSGIYGAIDG